MVGFISKRDAAQDRWTITLEQDGDDLILPLPPDFLEANDWQTGDTIQWLDNEDGTWQLINMRTLNDGLTNPNATA